MRWTANVPLVAAAPPQPPYPAMVMVPRRIVAGQAIAVPVVAWLAPGCGVAWATGTVPRGVRGAPSGMTRGPTWYVHGRPAQLMAGCAGACAAPATGRAAGNALAPSAMAATATALDVE